MPVSTVNVESDTDMHGLCTHITPAFLRLLIIRYVFIDFCLQFQPHISCFPKGNLLPSERRPFTVQEVTFYNTKACLLKS